MLAGYLAGSMPFGLWLVRAFRGEDVRTQGSGNIGASNVWRVYGPRLGAPIVVLDVAKGFVPAFVGTLVAGPLAGVLAGAAAMVGHWRPIFLGFARGGKAVAAAGGAFLGVAPLVGLAGVGIWLLLFLATRYASVASVSTALLLPVVALLLGAAWPVVAFAAIAGLVVVLLHRPNLRRLREGTESRFELKQLRRRSA
ncbi:MAG TPA: glycerol-3-phosphate 1-O-acyltransferase PlsY [Gaiellaceae bacterium]|nr:glycerol-3-phosphate 1-O-acyltransferase PlsY [Gaiellaceae bacterium]